MAEPRNRYSAVSLLLHWVMAVMMIGQILLIMAHDATEGPLSREFVNLHKSIGLTILVLTLVRIGWRLANPALPLPDRMRTWEKVVARVVHIGFYVVMLAMPLLGWAASSAAGRDILWFGLFEWPALPIEGGRPVARQLMGFHELGAKVVYVLILVHVAGALKHHFFDRDNVLHRMIPLIPRRP